MTRTTKRGLQLAALLLLALGSGCRCGQEGGGAPDARSALPAVPEAARGQEAVSPSAPAQVGAPSPLARRLCDAIHEIPAGRRATCCGGSSGLLLTRECVRTLSAALGSGAVKLEASAVEACSQAMERAHQGCEWVGPEATPLPAECQGLLHGTLAQGAPCRSSLECLEGLHCQGAGPRSPGVCGAPASVGEACSFLVDPLTRYTRQAASDPAHPECQGHCFQRKCTAPATRGERCTLEEQCGPGLHCAGGTCAEGELASLGRPCASGGCGDGARCVEGACAAPKPAGAACEDDSECLGGCVRPDGGRQGTCGPRCDAR